MNIRQVLTAAPPTPACFPDRTLWAEYLQSSQNGSGSRPFSNGVYRPNFNFCKCCTPEFKDGMAAAGKCNPNKFRALVLSKEAA